MKLTRPEKEIELLFTTDVLVVGGGPAGIGAAVSSARAGKRTILLEKRGFLGGNITACYVENCNYYLKNTEFSSEGLYAEIEKAAYEEYGNDNIRQKNLKAFNSEYLKVFLDELMAENKVQVLFHSFVNEVIMKNDRIEGVIVQTKKGPKAIVASVIIDTTGDGDVSFAAGVPYEQGRSEDGLCMPGTVSMRITGVDSGKLMEGTERLTEIGNEFKRAYRAGETGLKCKRQDLPFGRLTKAGQISYINYSCEYGLDPTDIIDLTKGEINCRQYDLDIYRYLKEHFEEFKDSEITSLSPEIGFRDSRRIEGRYKLTIEDMESNRHFDDVIAVFPRFYDMLSPDANMDGDGKVEGKGYKGHIYEPVVDSRTFEIPYRSLVPINISNLLVAGRCISADHVAESGVRAISLCMYTGQAAGTAAALSIDSNVIPGDVDIKALQSALRAQNINIPE
ncbi:MAG: FAD-dependent oxidoreductase [Lachnospiraceae bacterium]|nr:FAD-dependent oxidoreductase [Lachnospiraceae bacterium]